MSLIFRALPLSFSVFLRALLILPLLFALYAGIFFGLMHVLGFPAVVLMFLLTPGMGGLVCMAVIRIALSILGATGDLDLGHMIKSGFLFGTVLFVFGIVLGLVAWLAFVAFLLSTGTSIHMLDLRYLVMASFSTPEVMIPIQMITLLIQGAFFAAILVPMAGCASGQVEYQRYPGFFYGFGASFRPLFVLCAGIPVLLYAISVATAADEMDLMRQAASLNLEQSSETSVVDRTPDTRGGYTHVAPVSNPDPVWKPAVMPEPPSFTWMSFTVAITVAILAALAQLWYGAWVCSAAALAFVRHRDEMIEQTENLNPPLHRIDPADLREFRKARKP